MVDADAQISENVKWETLERLYDNPDEQISKLLEDRPEEGTVENEHTVFRALANEDRLRLLEALRQAERCGCELIAILDAPQSTVATHLRKLRKAGLVKSRKSGKWNYYRIADTAVMDILDLAASIDQE
ncbi:ArsR family transcriptional regulator [Halogeometricum pallidum JCM 14848]|uniref:ArsR family transcriptional regulator n=1 Tax=Halogeometricum pallidum JCM 14848 TaxID=1227487 RepID=M0DGS9_HALPD|nr:metalloregulator ArsR/SmtB family transcription factor [Halogeometricum pallidum]ELZ33927.1 ArsR family transcriptional regulator [Halogeometricum pallidum JCM 14848]